MHIYSHGKRVSLFFYMCLRKQLKMDYIELKPLQLFHGVSYFFKEQHFYKCLFFYCIYSVLEVKDSQINITIFDDQQKVNCYSLNTLFSFFPKE